MDQSLTICFTISDPAGLAADLFLGRMIESGGELGAIIQDAIKARYQEAATRAGMVYNDRPYKFTWHDDRPAAEAAEE